MEFLHFHPQSTLLKPKLPNPVSGKRQAAALLQPEATSKYLHHDATAATSVTLDMFKPRTTDAKNWRMGEMWN